MASKDLIEIMRRVNELSLEEQQELISHLSASVLRRRRQHPRRSWSEIGATAPYPLLGEDAQAWVTRTRHDDDEVQMRENVRSSMN